MPQGPAEFFGPLVSLVVQHPKRLLGLYHRADLMMRRTQLGGTVAPDCILLVDPEILPMPDSLAHDLGHPLSFLDLHVGVQQDAILFDRQADHAQDHVLGALVRESAELATKLSQLCQRGLRDLSAIQLLEFVGVEVPDEVELHRQLQVCLSEQGHGIITAEHLHKDAVCNCIREKAHHPRKGRCDAGPVLDTKVEFGQLQDSPPDLNRAAVDVPLCIPHPPHRAQEGTWFKDFRVEVCDRGVGLSAAEGDRVEVVLGVEVLLLVLHSLPVDAVDAGLHEALFGVLALVLELPSVRVRPLHKILEDGLGVERVGLVKLPDASAEVVEALAVDPLAAVHSKIGDKFFHRLAHGVLCVGADF